MSLNLTLPLPGPEGVRVQSYRLRGQALFSNAAPVDPRKAWNRVVYSAAHVVADAQAAIDPWLQCAVDWDQTLAYRERLWDLGLGVAEAMDTAQRGMGLDWPTSLELIQRTARAAKAREREGRFALVASGCGTDHLDLEKVSTVEEVIEAYLEQMEAIEATGGRLILMASRALAKVARGPQDYWRVYDRLLTEAREPVILHWLGDMFDPALSGYWGDRAIEQAMATLLAIIRAHAAKVDGVKISLLDMNREIEMRRQLPEKVRMYTGDDFNYAALIAGDGHGPGSQGYSDALLGIFDAIAPAASAAFSAFGRGDVAGFQRILEPTVALSRHIFCAPTRFYKTGVVFLAYLNGHQSHTIMVNGQHSARSIVHLSQLFVLADQAHLLDDPQAAVRRMQHVLACHGVE
jgi:hypothetical protein